MPDITPERNRERAYYTRLCQTIQFPHIYETRHIPHAAGCDSALHNLPLDAFASLTLGITRTCTRKLALHVRLLC